MRFHDLNATNQLLRPSRQVGSTNPRRTPIEALEKRMLLTATIINAIGNQVFPQDSGVEQAFLYGVFADSNGASDLTFSATSTNPSVLTSSVSGAELTITPVTGQSGFARVQMIATDPIGGRVVNTFRVQVTAAAERSLDVQLGAGSPTSIRYTQSNGTSAVVSLSGPGSAVVHFGGDNLARAGGELHGLNEELESITLGDTTAASTVTIAGKKSGTSLPVVGQITASGSLGHLKITNAVLDGDMTIDGALSNFDVDFAEGGTLSIGSGAVSILGKSFVDENFTSSSPINSIKLLQWTNSDNTPEVFSGAFIRSVNTRGNFTPGLQLSGDGAPGRTLDHIKIPGAVGGVWKIVGACAPLTVGTTEPDWNATFDALPSFFSRGDLKGNLTAPTIRTISVRGAVGGATITLTDSGATDLVSLKAKVMSFANVYAAGNVGTISVQLMQFTSVFAGLISPPFRALPTSAADFAQAASIKSITVRGGVSANDFISSYIAASSLGSLQLGTAQTDNGGSAFGIVGSGIGQLQFVAGHRHIGLRNVHDAATLASQLAAQNASLGDMTIQIV